MNLDTHIKDIMKEVISSHARRSKTLLNIKSDGTLDMRFKETKQLFREEFKRKILCENRLHNTEIKTNKSNYRKEILELNGEDIIHFTKEIKN
jgi:hypothetical protein|tara:strand:+ start:3660 stop:3938 length:279 start_codon:yes stop_codon:yes gene_type:complete